MTDSKNNVLETIKSLAYIIVLVILIRGTIFEMFRIPSGSMKDTLLIGDTIFVTKFSYGIGPHSFIIPLPINKRLFFTHPKRGDIIVFKTPHDDDPKDKYIKRLIGLPGDKIQMINKVIYVNNQPFNLQPNGEFFDQDTNITYDKFIETNIDGVQYDVLYDKSVAEEIFPNTTPLYEIPQGYYFFVGDNRNHSADSRYINQLGFIHETRLLGKTQYIMWNGSIFTNIMEFFSADRCFTHVK